MCLAGGDRERGNKTSFPVIAIPPNLGSRDRVEVGDKYAAMMDDDRPKGGGLHVQPIHVDSYCCSLQNPFQLPREFIDGRNVWRQRGTNEREHYKYVHVIIIRMIEHHEAKDVVASISP